jgi:hypothetical protein
MRKIRKSEPDNFSYKKISEKELRIRCMKKQFSRYKCTNLPRDFTKCKKTITCKCQGCAKIINTPCNCRKCERKRFPAHFKHFPCKCGICTRTPNSDNISKHFDEEYRHFDETTQEFTTHPKHNIEDLEALATHYQFEKMAELNEDIEKAEKSIREDFGLDNVNLKKCEKRRLQYEYQVEQNLNIKNFMPKMKVMQKEKASAIQGFCDHYGRIPPCFRERMAMKCKFFLPKIFCAHFFYCLSY